MIVRAYLPADEMLESRRTQRGARTLASGDDPAACRRRPSAPLPRRTGPRPGRNTTTRFASVAGCSSCRPGCLRPNDDRLPIVLDPGMAFGTGTHPSTQLCLAALEDHLHPGDEVIDLGCGSGILSIAAARLGARRRPGPGHRSAGRPYRAARTPNATAWRRRSTSAPVRLPDLLELAAPRSADLMVANILAPVLDDDGAPGPGARRPARRAC